MSPWAPRQACQRCGGAHRAGETCPQAVQAQDAYRRAQDRQRGSASSRGYGSPWRATRAAFIQAHPQCSVCWQPTTDVDHRDGDSRNNAPENLQPFCHAHHSARTARDQGFGKARRGKAHVTINQEGTWPR